MNGVTTDFGYHVLLGEVEGLLVDQIDVDVRILASVDLAIFGSIRCSWPADLELHLVLLSDLIACKLGVCQGIDLDLL